MFGFRKKSVFVFTILFFAACNSSVSIANETLRHTGDWLKIVNPAVTAVFSTQEKGLGHFGIVWGQSMALMGAGQFLGKKTEWEIGRRPTRNGRKGNYHGFPSGHTTSAWASAAYSRVFFDKYKVLAIPLYASAIVTGYSRLEAKRHTTIQVLGAVALSEGVTYLNSKMKWSQNYSGFDLKFGDDGVAADFVIRF